MMEENYVVYLVHLTAAQFKCNQLTVDCKGDKSGTFLPLPMPPPPQKESDSYKDDISDSLYKCT